MKVYLDLLKTIKEKGTYKAAAREGMPGTLSLFGYQFRHDLSEGFPLLTTKKLSFNNIVVELLWFLSGDTNIKYLVDNGCSIWNEDAYNYYTKVAKQLAGFENYEIFHAISQDDWDPKPLFGSGGGFRLHSYGEFTEILRTTALKDLPRVGGYILGDCGKQYGWLWRNWGGESPSPVYMVDVNMIPPNYSLENEDTIKEMRQLVKEIGLLPLDTSPQPKVKVDQIKELIAGLRNNPMGRRHIISAWNPTTLNDMALNACHALVQFNCRPMSQRERSEILWGKAYLLGIKETPRIEVGIGKVISNEDLDKNKIPKYKLDCQMYQRSADVFLGVPYNIASYALLTHMLCKVLNMVPGEFIHTFGDVHIYENHMDQVDVQLSREPKTLPTYKLDYPCDTNEFEYLMLEGGLSEALIKSGLKGYEPLPGIRAKLSTGLQ